MAIASTKEWQRYNIHCISKGRTESPVALALYFHTVLGGAIYLAVAGLQLIPRFQNTHKHLWQLLSSQHSPRLLSQSQKTPAKLQGSYKW